MCDQLQKLWFTAACHKFVIITSTPKLTSKVPGTSPVYIHLYACIIILKIPLNLWTALLKYTHLASRNLHLPCKMSIHQWRSQPSLSGGAKWKNLPDFCLFFPIFLYFHNFFALSHFLFLSPLFIPLFPNFWQIFCCQGGTLPPAPHWLCYCNPLLTNVNIGLICPVINVMEEFKFHSFPAV